MNVRSNDSLARAEAGARCAERVAITGKTEVAVREATAKHRAYREVAPIRMSCAAQRTGRSAARRPCAPRILRRAAGVPITQPVARRPPDLAGSGAAARQLQRLVGRRGG